MLSNLRILSVVIAISATFPAMAIAGNERDFSRCPANWAPYVAMVEEFKSSFPQAITHEFLFMSAGTGVRNCLNEGFSENYLTSLQIYLISVNQVIDETQGTNSSEKFSVGRITQGPIKFSIIWLPDDEMKLEGDECRDFISKELVSNVDATKF